MIVRDGNATEFHLGKIPSYTGTSAVNANFLSIANDQVDDQKRFDLNSDKSQLSKSNKDTFFSMSTKIGQIMMLAVFGIAIFISLCIN